MKTYRISNRISGVTVGDYEADDPMSALDVMAREAGYDSYEEASVVTGDRGDDGLDVEFVE